MVTETNGLMGQSQCHPQNFWARTAPANFCIYVRFDKRTEAYSWNQIHVTTNKCQDIELQLESVSPTLSSFYFSSRPCSACILTTEILSLRFSYVSLCMLICRKWAWFMLNTYSLYCYSGFSLPRLLFTELIQARPGPQLTPKEKHWGRLKQVFAGWVPFLSHNQRKEKDERIKRYLLNQVFRFFQKCHVIRSNMENALIFLSSSSIIIIFIRHK